MQAITTKHLDAIKRDPVVRRCVRAFIEAKAFAQLQRELVEPIHAEALALWKPTATRNGRPGEPITDIRRLYLCEDDALCADIYADIDQRLKEAGFTVSRPGNCPALEAETLQTEAERAVLTAACAHLPPPMDNVNAIACTPDAWDKLVDIVASLTLSKAAA
ncbi:MAG: hypothetical protein ACIAQU_04255 [Phycisphaerales bacterium JB064]